MDQTQIQSVVSDSVATLYDEQSRIIGFDVGERTICACLAAILQRSFNGLFVHVEYNRRGVVPKEIELPDSNGDLSDGRVFPDIIVHEPGDDRANLLVIEVKKSTNTTSDDHDISKLIQFKHQLSYQHAVFIRLATGDGAKLDEVRFRWL